MCTSYILVQVLGAIAGVVIAHLMFGEQAFSFSLKDRSGQAQLLSEFIATFGLVFVILAVSTTREKEMPYAVGAYITSAYWFTSSTSFANPAVTLARSLTPTFAGVRPTDIGGFIFFQLCGALAAFFLFKFLQASPNK